LPAAGAGRRKPEVLPYAALRAVEADPWRDQGQRE
jgi:hypothetical protein